MIKCKRKTKSRTQQISKVNLSLKIFIDRCRRSSLTLILLTIYLSRISSGAGRGWPSQRLEVRLISSYYVVTSLYQVGAPGGYQTATTHHSVCLVKSTNYQGIEYTDIELFMKKFMMYGRKSVYELENNKIPYTIIIRV